MFNLITHKQSDHLIAILSFQGDLDRLTYRDLINLARDLYTSGYSNLVLDMRGIQKLGLSGTFALYTAAMLFNGDTPRDPDQGLLALRAMIDDVLSKQSHHFKLLQPQPAVKKLLSRSGLPVYDDMESVLTSFTC